MEDYLEEDEIKIEYFESFEADPLCEKLNENSILTDDALVTSFSPSSEECEIQLNNDAENAKHHYHHSNSSDKTQEDFEHYVDTEPRNHIHWYREIDDSGKFVCQFCDLSYSTIQTIRHHVKIKHPEDAKALRNIIKNNRRTSKKKCRICEKQFKDINCLKQHMKEHYAENLLTSCQVCLATFNNEQEMMEHLYQKHENVRNTKIYSCSTCGYRTKKLSHFKQHNNTHEQNKQLKCGSCDYATNYLPNLKIHQRIHTNYKPYFCTYHNCDYRCSAKSALRSHQLKHNPEQNMLYCDRCTYKTVYKNSLKKHIDSHKRNTLKVV